jgi:hypothetical protein
MLRLVAFVLALAVAPAAAQDRIPIFDAHMHYNWEPKPFYSVEQLREVFRRNGVTGVLANSRPNLSTQALVAAKAPELWVVPFIRPYRTRADIRSWFGDPAIWALVQEEYKRGFYRGVGEFHVYGSDARGETAVKVMRFAVERNLFLLAHCDEAALEILFSHAPNAKIIWAHTGFTTPPERVEELFSRYPALMAELSFRGGITDAAGEVTPEWRELFARHSDRFLVGSDAWVNERWAGYDGIIDEYRRWLAQLPREQALRIAHGNAERLFGPRRVD